MIQFLSKELSWIDVDYWFYVFNDLSLIYIIVPFFVLELIRYAWQKRLNTNLVLDSVANIITFGAFLTIEFLLGLLAVTKLYFWVYNHISLPHLELNWITIITCVLLADFAYYWEHRFMHRVNFAWATHSVHHSSPFFNISVAYRFGPMDGVWPIFFHLPLVLLGFNPFVVFFAEMFVQIYQTLLHTETIKKLPKPVEAVMNTPSHHRVHHGSNKAYLDKNYAGIFIIWDRLFGSFAREDEPVIYGLVKPINSINPLVAFFHGFWRVGNNMYSAKGLKNKVMYFVGPPDWSPTDNQN